MLSKILLPPVEVVEVLGDLGGAVERLHPLESAAIIGAPRPRQEEFATGRWCAHQAVRLLGATPAGIGVGPLGAPVWPSKTTGSITHCEGYRAAAVAWKRDVRSLGIDAEPARDLPDKLIRRVATVAEFAEYRRLSDQLPQFCWGALLLSAKESLFKMLGPAGGGRLALRHSQVRFFPGGQFLVQRMLVHSDPESTRHRVDGYWMQEASRVYTCAVEHQESFIGA